MSRKDEEKLAWNAYVNHFGKAHATKEDFRNRYDGCYKTREDWSNHCAIEDRIPSNWFPYIDFEQHARTSEVNDATFVEYEGKVYVFMR